MTSTTTTLAPTATQAPTTTTTPPTTTSPPTTTTPPTTRVAYDREDWGSWADADGDCINTRHEVLILESLIEVEMDPSGCKVVSGRWFDPFSGTSLTDPSLIDIDHFVPLCNAHASGGWAWSVATKRDYYNDLSDPLHLIAVSASANRSKGCRGPEEWMPPDSNYWCSYAQTWTSIKARWGLTATGSETAKLQLILGTCDEPLSNDAVTPTVAVATTAVPTTTDAPATTAATPSNPGDSKNCGDFNTYAEAKAWFDTYYPYYGDVAGLDGNNDLIPCQSLPGAP